MESQEFAQPNRDSEVARRMPRLNQELVERKKGSKVHMTQIYQCDQAVVIKIAHRVRCKLQYLYGNQLRVFAFDEIKGTNNWQFFEQMEKKHLNEVDGYLILNTMRDESGKNTGIEINLVDKVRIFKNRLSFDGKRQSLLPSTPECVKYRAEVKDVLSKVFQMI